jgi:FAD/FMN-containing dehydrogenase
MDFQTELEDAFGEAVSFDPQILRSYDHDLGEMPWLLTRMVRHTPAAVVVARSAEDAATALRVAGKYGVPVTPRAQASSGYGGSMPSRGGLMLDLSGFNRVLRIDVERQTADVEPGVVWEELSRELRKKGLDTRLCPTSAPSSTAGGWFAMGGVGIGSLEYGAFFENVLEIDVISPDGRSHTLSGEDMAPFYQTCGALGIITRLRLACRAAEPMTPVAVRLPSAAAAVSFVELARSRLCAYSAAIQCAKYCAMRAGAEGHAPDIDEGFLAVLAVPEKRMDHDEAARFAAAVRGRLLPEEVAGAEWNGRYYPMRIKKQGPSLLVGEFFIPAAGFAATYEDLQKALPDDAFGIEAFAVRDGRFAVLVYLLDDAKSPLYPVRMIKAMIPLRVAERHGGSAYATGMWFSALAGSVYGPEKLRRVTLMKKSTDPRNILNPGKIGGPRLPFLPFINLSRCILLASSLAAPLAVRLTYKKAAPAAAQGDPL